MFCFIYYNFIGAYHPSHQSHPRGRSRIERERVDYEEDYSSGAGMPVYHPAAHHTHHAHHPQYHAVPRETYPAARGGPQTPHNTQPHIHPTHSHRSRDPNDDYHSPHQTSSRRALNAI